MKKILKYKKVLIFILAIITTMCMSIDVVYGSFELNGNNFKWIIVLATSYILINKALESGNKYAILKPIAKLSNVDLTIILERRMSFWLLNNYLNYQYETEEALVLLEAYNKLKASANLASVADYLAITDEVNNLYVKFVNMFNYNRIVNFRSGITASDAY